MVEVLTPDFLGDTLAIDCVLEAEPEVYNHNMETGRVSYKKVRGRADYRRSLDLLDYVKKQAPRTADQERADARPGRNARRSARGAGRPARVSCDNLTLGQYLAPTLKHLPVIRYVPPAEFDELAVLAHSLGFVNVASGPYVRSSYHAEEMVSPHA